MWGRTCIPTKGYPVLYPFKRHVRCAQAQHFLVFCWLVVALLRAPGKGTLQGLRPSLPSKLHYWPTVRMVRSEQWEAQAVITDWAAAPRRSLPPPTNGGLYLIGDRTLKAKRGRKHPLGHCTRHGEHEPYQFGCELVVVIARWDRFRVPVAVGLIDPQRRGHQSILFRQMLQAVVPPGGGQQVGVVADAGFAAHATLRLMTEQPYAYVLAMPRTRQFTHGTSLRALGQHLPKRCYARRASDKPDGRRHDYWGFVRHATLHNLGDVTIVLAKKRRNDGPKRVKSIGTHLTEASAGTILSISAWRWGVEGTIKELKSGLHLGQMQGTKEAERVRRSVALSVVAYLLLVRLYGPDEAQPKEWSLFKLKERFAEDVAQEHMHRSDLRWQRKLKQLKAVA